MGSPSLQQVGGRKQAAAKDGEDERGDSRPEDHLLGDPTRIRQTGRVLFQQVQDEHIRRDAERGIGEKYHS